MTIQTPSTTLTLDRSAFQSAVIAACRFAEKKATMPIINHVRLCSDLDGLTVTSTNLDVESQTRIAAFGLPIVDVCIPAHRLKDILTKAPKGSQPVALTIITPASVDIDAKGARRSTPGSIALTVEGASYTLATLPAEDWPQLARPESQVVGFDLQTVDLARLLNKVTVAMSTEETRYYLNGVYLRVVASDIVAVATDGHRLCRYTLPNPQGVAFPGVIIPRDTVTELARAAGARGAPSTVRLRISDFRFEVALGATRIMSKIIDGTFPDYARVIPTDNTKRITVDREAFGAALSQVAAAHSGKHNRAMKLTVDRQSICLAVKDAENGSAYASALADTDAPSGFEIGFNSTYVKSLCALVDAANVTFVLGDAGSPGLIVDPSDDRLTIVLMPMRV